jgi:hypothetical protein
MTDETDSRDGGTVMKMMTTMTMTTTTTVIIATTLMMSMIGEKVGGEPPAGYSEVCDQTGSAATDNKG